MTSIRMWFYVMSFSWMLPFVSSRSWKYDRCMVHIENKNAYKITKDGKRFQLLLMEDEEP